MLKKGRACNVLPGERCRRGLCRCRNPAFSTFRIMPSDFFTGSPAHFAASVVYNFRMRLSERLKWIFAILFVLCGIPILFVDIDAPDSSAGHLLAGIAALLLGGFGLCLAWSAWETGTIRLQHFNYSGAGQPRRFMGTVLLILAAGCGTLAAAVWFLFFK